MREAVSTSDEHRRRRGCPRVAGSRSLLSWRLIGGGCAVAPVVRRPIRKTACTEVPTFGSVIHVARIHERCPVFFGVVATPITTYGTVSVSRGMLIGIPCAASGVGEPAWAVEALAIPSEICMLLHDGEMARVDGACEA